MCTEIQVNGKHCRTIGDLAAAIGREDIKFSRGYFGWQLTDDICLCPVDTRRTSLGLGMSTRWEHGGQVWGPHDAS